MMQKTIKQQIQSLESRINLNASIIRSLIKCANESPDQLERVNAQLEHIYNLNSAFVDEVAELKLIDAADKEVKKAQQSIFSQPKKSWW